MHPEILAKLKFVAKIIAMTPHHRYLRPYWLFKYRGVGLALSATEGNARSLRIGMGEFPHLIVQRISGFDVDVYCKNFKCVFFLGTIL